MTVRDGTQPVYLVATSRSGTNLLRSILAGHPEVAAPAPLETGIPDTTLPDLDPRRQSQYVRDVLICQRFSPHGLHEDLSPAAVCERTDEWTFAELQAALYEAYADCQDASVWLTKYTGPQFTHVQDALRFHDELKLLYLVRDARDVVLSMKSTTVGPYHPYFSAGTWQVEQSIGRNLLETYGIDVHAIQYEDLLEDPNREIRDACEFLGIEAVEGMLAYHEREDTRHMSSKTHLFENLSRPIISDNYGKFRDQLPADEIRIVEKVAGDELAFFGYDLVHSAAELDEVTLADEDEYEQAEKELSTAFARRKWREDTREMLDLWLWRKYRSFLLLRYHVCA